MTPHLIIAGNEKAGTSSDYRYLAALPSVAASTGKETDYFRFHIGPLSEYELNFPAAEVSDGKPPRTICNLTERGVCCYLLRTQQKTTVRHAPDIDSTTWPYLHQLDKLIA